MDDEIIRIHRDFPEVGDILSPRTKLATAFGPDLEEPHLGLYFKDEDTAGHLDKKQFASRLKAFCLQMNY